MSLPGVSPGECFSKFGILEHEAFEITIGDRIAKIGLTGATVMLGAAAVAEATRVIADTLTDAFGMYHADVDDTTE